MSEKDEFDEQVERLLPCKNESCSFREYPRCISLIDCPAHYRPAVAAALRESDRWRCLVHELRDQIADLRAELDNIQNGNSELVEQMAEMVTQLAELRADKEQLKRSLDYMNDCCLRAEAERDQLKAKLAKTQSE